MKWEDVLKQNADEREYKGRQLPRVKGIMFGIPKVRESLKVIDEFISSMMNHFPETQEEEEMTYPEVKYLRQLREALENNIKEFEEAIQNDEFYRRRV
tara:strand:- start:550 stop:843 length:294 start_codon:yes stop_codon:yes gene_type:complete